MVTFPLAHSEGKIELVEFAIVELSDEIVNMALVNNEPVVKPPVA